MLALTKKEGGLLHLLPVIPGKKKEGEVFTSTSAHKKREKKMPL